MVGEVTDMVVSIILGDTDTALGDGEATDTVVSMADIMAGAVTELGALHMAITMVSTTTPTETETTPTTAAEGVTNITPMLLLEATQDMFHVVPT